MSHKWCCILVLFILLPGVVGIYSPPHQASDQPGLSRGPGDGDVNVTINLPTAGMQIMEADGLVVNVTVANAGGTYVNRSFNVTLHVQNKNNIFHKFLDTYEVTDLGAPGNSTTFSFKNWTDLFISGDYTINVTTHLFNDTNPNNDTALMDIHVYPSIQPLELGFDSARVLPPRGTTDFLFNFSVTYTFNSFPENINVTIDDTVFDLEQADITDMNASNGKDYYFLTKLDDIGLHTFRFQAACGNNSTASNIINGPWVNLTLQNPNVRPDAGNITDLYNFTVTYGDFNNNIAPVLTLNINTETFDFHPINPSDTDYSDANNNFYCKVYGYQVGMGPLTWTITAEAGEDSLTIGPFNFTGPSTDTGTIRGNVKKSDGFPLKDVKVALNPFISTTWTNGDGDYVLEEVPTGHNYQLIFSKLGFINSTAGSITVPKDTTVYWNTSMSPLPVGGDIVGWVVDEIRKIPLPGAKVTATTAQGTLTATTDQVGRYEFYEIQAQTGVNLSVAQVFYIPEYTLVDVKEVQVTVYNFTLIEEDPPFLMTPRNNTLNVSVDTDFVIEFQTAVNISTFNATIYAKEDGKWIPVNITRSYNNETYVYTMDPVMDLRYNTDHKINLDQGLERTGGSLYLWRDFSLVYRTTFKPLKNITVYPKHTQDDIPLNVTLRITLDVEVDTSSVNVILAKKDSLSVNGKKNVTHFNPEGSAQVHTLIVFTTGGNLTNNTIYSVRLLKTLTDSLGNVLLTEDYDWYFRTIKHPVDDDDEYPVDINDNDIPDWWEELWGLNIYLDQSGEDPDNDDLTNLREYQLGLNPLSNDTDGDGMTDGWEDINGLDPRNPSDAGGDLDGDGYTNKEEFDMGTDPGDDSDPAPENNGDTDTVWYITFAVAAILVIVIIIVIIIVLRSRREIKEEEAEADEEDMMNGSLVKTRTKAKRTRSREEEEVLEESESLGIDLEEAEKAFMEDYASDEEEE